MSIKKDLDVIASKPLAESTNLRVALGYVRLLGFSVFPLHSTIHDRCTCNNSNCSNKGKHPATKNGLKDATTDEQKIIEWWTRRPLLNIAIATGSISGIFALDTDTDIHQLSGMTGIEKLEQLELEHGELPPTPHQITGSGGSHHIFKYVDGIKNMVNLFPSIDVRGDGGYIVAAPSIHESGKQYNWELEHLPSQMEIAEAPKWLLDSILQKNNGQEYKAKPVSEYIRLLQGIGEGERNNALMTLIGHLIVRLDYREAFELVHIWNEARVNPPLDRDTVTKAFNNILRLEAVKKGR